MSKMYIASVAAILIGFVGVAGWQFADAHGEQRGFGFQRSLESKAQVLNLSEEELAAQLEEKTLPQIAEESGISSEEWHAHMKEVAHQRWQSMGLNDEEITVREQRMEQHHDNCQGGGMMGMRNMRNMPGSNS